MINTNKEYENSETKINLLEERFNVEHFFCLLKKGFKRISTINDKTLKHYNNFLNTAAPLISLNITIDLA